MTYIYSVNNDDSGRGTGEDYFATKEEAVGFARECARDDYYPVEVWRWTVAADLPRRALFVALLMHLGWSVSGSNVLVATIPPRLEQEEEL